MSMLAICQRCGQSKFSWTIHQAEFHVKGIDRWKVQLCEDCQEAVETALRVVLTKTNATETPT